MKNDEYLTEEEIEELIHPFTLVVPSATWKKIMEYTVACKLEISEFADVTFDPDMKTFTLGDIYLLPQRVSEIETVMEEEDVAKFLDECMKSGKKELPRCWVHSHVEMEAFFSPTDENTYQKTLDNKKWMIALVVNKHGEHKAILQQYAPFPFTWELNVEIERLLPDVTKEIYAEVAQKVKKAKGFLSSLFPDEETPERIPRCGVLPTDKEARRMFFENNDLYQIHHATLGWVWTNDQGDLWKNPVN